ncbi:dTMP kinase [Pusillimonas sp. T2]|uniref:dTMP kinase n=1 Tax=Pusillimonas sp. T2 TaxID=1548123 RepID=UPI000B9CAFBE|nr:dTMP kinase [Pusillimonas sp. T2]OXR49322.1 dTMP kinase [Pusillimonas sp. T2]
MSVKQGLFLTLEGLDGAGKSTHIDGLIQQLQSYGINVVSTREPGGTAVGEALRDMLLHQPMHLKTETLLMFAARCEHIEQVIRPALARGEWVLCDRFTDATFAYQGGGRELGGAAVTALEQWVHPDLQPDLTWLFDVPLEVARQRLTATRTLDRFEQEGNAFFERTRAAYHARVAAQPGRFRVIDATQSIEQIRTVLQQQVEAAVVGWRTEGVARPVADGPSL